MKYSKELKEQIAQEIREVGNITAVARKHGISPTTVHGWIYHKKVKAGPIREIRKELSAKDEQADEIKKLKKQLDKKDLEIRIMKDLLKKNLSDLPYRREVALSYIQQGTPKNFVLGISQIPRSSWYYRKKIKTSVSSGRPVPGYSYTTNNIVVLDPAIIQALKSYRLRPEFMNGGGYQALRHYLRRDYAYIVNPKKIYRLMKENGLLLHPRKKFRRDDKKISSNKKISGPGQLWQFDIKYGFIHGENRFFYLGAFIDVFTKEVVGYHVGTSCKGIHLAMAFDQAIRLHRPELSKLTIRSDNGPQMSSNQFKNWINDRVTHEFIPAGEPNKNAFIEAFFSIYEIEFLQVRYFKNFSEAYKQSVEFINHYNMKRLHGSIKFLPPVEFKQRFIVGEFSQNFIQA